MAKYKLVVYCADERETREFDNIVNNLKDAATKAKELLAQYIEDYPDTYVACYEYHEDIKYPSRNYRCWRRDCDGEEYWWWMKMGTYSRIGFYLD